MAAIVVDTTKVRAVEIHEQVTGPASEAINPGDAIRYDPATGFLTKSKGTDTDEANIKAISFQTANIAGVTVTGMVKGIMDFGSAAFDALDYGDPVYLGDADGSLDTAPGTVPICIGHVVPLYGHIPPRKGLNVEISNNLVTAWAGLS